MMLMNPIKDAGAPPITSARATGDTISTATGLRREWGGKVAERLGLTGTPALEQFSGCCMASIRTPASS